MEKDKNNEQFLAPDPKEPWQPPTIEQLDFASAEAAYIPGPPSDFGIYAS